ncbi:hypothetical protein EXW34_31355 (plasmid) [Bacillus mycoides]|uniref:hypothetical protein n=1 Tax=Bacillus mycoides TaxID=1405 RepID=UPI001C009BFC|nr:hypothetical protein [Bacillus mycoides]QWI25670.1 hypothetical protein EXW34_31355 [Bacillus mycoides]
MAQPKNKEINPKSPSIKKLSIRISENAEKQLNILSANTGASRSQFIVYAISHIRKNLNSRDEVESLKSTISLSKNNISISLKKSINDDLQNIATAYAMKKNVLVGLLVSDFLENMDPDSPWLRTNRNADELHIYKLFLHKSYFYELKSYTFNEYVQLKIPVVLGILSGPKEIHQDDFNEYIETSAKLPKYLVTHIKKESERYGIPEYNYVDSCVRNYWESTKKQT